MLILSIVPFFLFYIKRYEMVVFSKVLITIQNSLYRARRTKYSWSFNYCQQHIFI